MDDIVIVLRKCLDHPVLRQSDSRMLPGALKEAANEIEKLRSTQFPAELTDELREILGMQNFDCCPMAHAFQAAGHDIPKKTEAEQAFILHWLVTMALKHGAEWRKHAGEELGQIIELAKASPERTDGANPPDSQRKTMGDET